MTAIPRFDHDQRGELIFHAKGEHQPIFVLENDKYRWLHFGSPGIQSAMDLKKPNRAVLPYMIAMLGISHFVQATSGCLLGVGGGGLLRTLSEEHPEIQVDAIEYDEAVLRVCEQYFNISSQAATYRLQHAEALDYVTHTDKQYDVMWLDLYGIDDLPPFMGDEAFYEACRSRLTSDGALAINLICQGSHRKYIELIRRVCNSQTIVVPIEGYLNTIVYAFNTKDYQQTIQKLLANGVVRKVKLEVELGMMAWY